MNVPENNEPALPSEPRPSDPQPKCARCNTPLIRAVETNLCSECETAVPSVYAEHHRRVDKKRETFMNNWANVDKHLLTKPWDYEYDETRKVFSVHNDGEEVCNTEYSEVAHAICESFNSRAAAPALLPAQPTEAPYCFECERHISTSHPHAPECKNSHLIGEPLCPECKHPEGAHQPKGYGGCSEKAGDDYCPCARNFDAPVAPAPVPSPEPAWRDHPEGTWFFYEAPLCANRYSVMERTPNGCSLVCSTPYIHEGAKRDMEEIVRLHNAASVRASHLSLDNIIMGTPLTFKYENQKGRIAERHVIPQRIYFGTTQYYSEPQWLLQAFDLDKLQDRTFSLRAALASSRTPQVEEVEQWRELLWLRHGCEISMLYGDDGEMQCNKCLIDFKRNTEQQIYDRFNLLKVLKWKQNTEASRTPSPAPSLEITLSHGAPPGIGPGPAVEGNYVQQEEASDQSPASPPSTSETPQSLIGKESQPATPEWSQDSSEALTRSVSPGLVAPTPLSEAELEEMEDRCEKAHRMIQSLCTPRGIDGHRDWIMSIPARLDYDPDIIISASLGDIGLLLKVARAARTALSSPAPNLGDFPTCEVCHQRVTTSWEAHADECDERNANEYHGENCLICKAQKEVALSSQPTQTWISVSVKLPDFVKTWKDYGHTYKTSEPVLAAVLEGTEYRYEVVTYDLDDEDNAAAWTTYGGTTQMTVTHWQPLPACPKMEP